MKCEYTLSGNYDIKISREVLVTHAALSKIEDVTAYSTDDVQIKCDYTGSDNPSIIWLVNLCVTITNLDFKISHNYPTLVIRIQLIIELLCSFGFIRFKNNITVKVRHDGPRKAKSHNINGRR